MNKSLFDIYTDYLICSFGLTTATGLCRLLDGEISHDQVTRLLSSPAKTSADLWRVVKPLVRQVESDDGVLIFDDSIEEKPSILSHMHLIDGCRFSRQASLTFSI